MDCRHRWVLFGSPDGAQIYDLETKSLQAFGLEEYGRLEKPLVVKDKFVVLWTLKRMHVLRAGEPYFELPSVENVWWVINVGEHIVIDRSWHSLLYHPLTGETEYLAPGRPICALNDDEFLLYGGGGSWARVASPLYN